MTESLPASPHPRIARLLAHWRGLAPADGTLPGRQHFDPRQVPDVLADLWLLDVLPSEPRQFRYRLVGSRLEDAGMPARIGDRVDDPRFADDVAAVRRVFDAVAATGQPYWVRGQPFFRHTRTWHSREVLLLPLASDGRLVDKMLGMTLFYRFDADAAAA